MKAPGGGRTQGRRPPSSSATRCATSRRGAGESVEQGSTGEDPGELLKGRLSLLPPFSPIGAQIQIRGGLAKGGLAYTDAVDARAVQVFVGNPRGWKLTEGEPAQDGPSPRAAPSAASRRSSTHRTWSTSAPRPRPPSSSRSPRSGTTSAAAPGSARRASSCTPAPRSARTATRPPCASCTSDCCRCSTPARRRPRLLIEPTAGGGRSLAATVEDLGPYLAALEGHPMVGVCFDTCHAWAAGHDLAVPGGMTATLDALRATVGPRPARAGARQRLAGRVRLEARPAHDDRRRLDRRRAVRRAARPPVGPASRWSSRRQRAGRVASAGHAATSPCSARCSRPRRRGLKRRTTRHSRPSHGPVR